jgi:hypothetical protein
LPLAILTELTVLAAELVLLANMAFAGYLAGELVGLVAVVVAQAILRI